MCAYVLVCLCVHTCVHAGVLRKYYLPSSFLSLTADEAAFQNLYQEMLLTLEPMTYLPFDLSIDFELRHQAGEAVGVGAAGGGGVASGTATTSAVAPEAASLSSVGTNGQPVSPVRVL